MKMFFEIRGAGLIRGGRRVLGELDPRQPLLLIREPTNPADKNAIIVADLMGQGAGYVQRDIAAQLAPRLDNGEVWTATFVRMVRHDIGLGRLLKPETEVATVREAELVE